MSSMNPMNPMAAMQAQQEAFMKAMAGSMGNWPGSTTPGAGDEAAEPEGEEEGLDDIKKQLAELQAKLSKLS
ncbi:hypothetical protein TA5114_00695 [Cognatishimia activa]|nr:hypothetical protein [Cognatishimia activa]CUK24906.1 hypothetical protein TA5114_00695 [Cognatishimia activa]